MGLNEGLNNDLRDGDGREVGDGREASWPFAVTQANGNIDWLNVKPDLDSVVRAALKDRLPDLFAEERHLMDAFLDADIRHALSRKQSWIVVPVTPREVDDGEVLRKIADEHLRLIAQSGGRLKILLVFNDYSASTDKQAWKSYQNFQQFVNENYFSKQLVDPLEKGKRISIQDCVSFVSLNDRGYQNGFETMATGTSIDRGSPGKGNAVTLGVLVALHRGAECVVLHDSDIRTFDETPIVQSLLLPLLAESYDITKLSFIRYAHGRMNGRLTRGFSQPILRAISDYAVAIQSEAQDGASRSHSLMNLVGLGSFRYPFSGEIGFSRSAVTGAPFHPTYGLESGHITHAARGAMAMEDPIRVGDVMVSRYDHLHSPVGADASLGQAGKSTGLHAMCEQTFASLIGPFLSQGILTKDDFSDDLIGSGGQVPPVIVDAESKKEPRKILALAYDSWRGDLTQMKNIAFTTLHQEIEARRARHVGAQDDTTGSVLAKVTSILYESQGDMHERRSFLVDGMAVSATDKLQAEVLRASFDSTYSTTALMAARLYLQLERELKKGPVFLDHVKRMLAGLKTGSQSTSPAEIIPLGEELRSWKEVNPQPEGWQVPLRK